MAKRFRIVPCKKRFKIQQRGFLGLNWYEYNYDPMDFVKTFKTIKKAKKYLAKRELNITVK